MDKGKRISVLQFRWILNNLPENFLNEIDTKIVYQNEIWLDLLLQSF